jgi:hypothetical protein
MTLEGGSNRRILSFAENGVSESGVEDPSGTLMFGTRFEAPLVAEGMFGFVVLTGICCSTVRSSQRETQMKGRVVVSNSIMDFVSLYLLLWFCRDGKADREWIPTIKSEPWIMSDDAEEPKMPDFQFTCDYSNRGVSNWRSTVESPSSVDSTKTRHVDPKIRIWWPSLLLEYSIRITRAVRRWGVRSSLAGAQLFSPQLVLLSSAWGHKPLVWPVGRKGWATLPESLSWDLYAPRLKDAYKSGSIDIRPHYSESGHLGQLRIS